MSARRNLCRLCITQCEEHKSLFDQNGECTGVYQLMDKYFNSKLLNSGKESRLNVLCMLCWHHISNFHNFQQFVFEAQEKLNLQSHGEPELKFSDSAIEVKEFLTLESTLPNTVQEQPRENICMKDDIRISSSSSQQENIDVFSIADSCSDYEFSLPDKTDNIEKSVLKEYLTNDDINEIEILSSDEEALQVGREMNGIELETRGSCSEAVEDDEPPQTLNEMPIKPSTKNKNTKNALMDVNDDAVIAEWKPYLECRLCSQKHSSFKLLRLHFRKKHPLSNFYVVCCRRKFTYRCKLGEHIRRHMNPYPFQCKVCVKSYTHKSNLISHMHTHRTNIVNKELKVAQPEIVSMKELNGANNSMATAFGIEEPGENYQQTQCVGNENNYKKLGKHTKKETNNRLQVTILPSEETDSSIVLNENASKDIHEDDAVIAQWKPRLNCEACGQTYLSFTSLREHFRQQHPQESFYVECCRHKFKYRCRLGDHIRRHINPHPFKCTFCVKRYSQRANLITHMQEMHEYRPKMTDKKLDDLVGQWRQELECAHCTRTYSSLRLLRHHFRNKHPKKVFHVLCCGLKLTRRREIEGHIRSHLKLFVSIFRCDHCDKCFTDRSSLDRHKFTSHKHNVNCKQIDGVNKSRKKNMDRAEEQLDNAIAQWKTNLKCMACSETLSTYTLLEEHYIKEHPNDKCYIVCCRQKLKQRAEIEDHMRLHCNPETYACTLCDECFIRSEDLNSHMQRNHSEVSSNGRRVSNRLKNWQVS